MDATEEGYAAVMLICRAMRKTSVSAARTRRRGDEESKLGEPLFNNRSISNRGISASAVALSLVLIARAGRVAGVVVPNC